MASGQLLHPPLEAAFRSVLRHHFVPDLPLEEVYQDRSIGTKEIDDTLVSSSSQPTMMAIMLRQLDLQPGQKVLEIGAGTGYNAALMAHIVGGSGHVIAVDIDQDIVDDARAHLQAAGYPQVQVVCGDGGYGFPSGGLYDRIILTVGAGDIMPAWWEQLKEGGRLVLPLELCGRQLSIAFEKQVDHLLSRAIQSCGFIRLRGVMASENESAMALGPEPGLTISMANGTLPVSVEQIYEWLQEPSSMLESEVITNPLEAHEGLALSVLLRERGACLLIAVGELAAQPVFSPLTTYRDANHIRTVGLVSAEGMALLAKPMDDVQPFSVQIVSYGNDTGLVAQLLKQIQRWDQSGQPLSHTMSIRAYPLRLKAPKEDMDDGSIRIEKTYTEFIIAL